MELQFVLVYHVSQVSQYHAPAFTYLTDNQYENETESSWRQ